MATPFPHAAQPWVTRRVFGLEIRQFEYSLAPELSHVLAFGTLHGVAAVADYESGRVLGALRGAGAHAHVHAPSTRARAFACLAGEGRRSERTRARFLLARTFRKKEN